MPSSRSTTSTAAPDRPRGNSEPPELAAVELAAGETQGPRLAPAARVDGSVFFRWMGRFLPGFLGVLLVAGLVALGQKTNWRLPSLSSLVARTQGPASGWCSTHSVAEALCVECRPDVMPRGKDYGWCKRHGVHECPLCHPDLAQLETPPAITEEERLRTDAALAFGARDENNSRCQLHLRRIQLASDQALHDLGIGVGPAERTSVTETITTLGEIGFDPTRVSRVSPRVGGILRRIEKHVGDSVRAGDILAWVDSVEVGKAKAEFQQAVTNLQLKQESLARRKSLGGETIAANVVQAAEAETAEAQVRLLTSRQSLIHLGLPVADLGDVESAPHDLARRLRWLGVPESLQEEVSRETSSSNWLPVRAPLDGEVLQCDNVPGESVSPGAALFLIADTRSVWVRLHVAIEDATRIRTGQQVRFQHEGHMDADEGKVAFVGLSVDDATRTVPVIVELPNVGEEHVAGAFGSATILLRAEPQAIVVPSSAVHWEGDCHIVFVRDRHFEHEGSPKIFHVRKVRPGVEHIGQSGPVTEIIAGLLPGEFVASANSGILRSELLKANLGAG